MKVKIPKITIEEGGYPGTTVITIDGMELPLDGVLGYKIEHSGGKLPVLSIDFSAMNLELKGVVMPKLPEILKDYYVSNMIEDKSNDA